MRTPYVIRRALIIVGAMLLISTSLFSWTYFNQKPYTSDPGELILSDCNKDFIIGKNQAAQSERLKRLLIDGDVDRWRDLSFRSGSQNEGLYVPYPDQPRADRGARIQVVDVYLYGRKTLEMKMPVVGIKSSGISISRPETTYLTCLDITKKDFIDFF